MSLPPQIAQALSQPAPPDVGKPGAMPPPGPGGGPMLTPAPKQGNLAGARADVQVCIKKLTMALQTFPPTSDDGKAIMKAIQILSDAFAESQQNDSELMPAQVMQAISGIAGPGAPGPGTPSAPPPTPPPSPM